jgi:hypothetical protein
LLLKSCGSFHQWTHVQLVHSLPLFDRGRSLFDTPPSFLMDSTTNPKVKTTEGEGVGVCSLARSTSRVEGRVGASGWD